MALSMTALLEKARQKLHVGDREFRATPNVRNPAMLAEAEDFAVHMNAYKQAVYRYCHALKRFLAVTPRISGFNLPRVWQAVEGGLAEPIRTEVSHLHPLRIGGDYHEEFMYDNMDILVHRMQGIEKPIDRWMDSLKTARARLRRLEQLRLEVDAQRRKVQRRYLGALTRMERAAGATRGEEEAAAVSASVSVSEEEEEGVADMDRVMQRQKKREDEARLALHEKRKLDAISASFEEQERLLFEQLSGLVRDAAWFKSYAAAALLVVKEAMQAHLVALGDCKLPLPGYGPATISPNRPYGVIGSIRHLIEGLPKVVVEGSTRRKETPIAALEAGTEVPGMELHAKRVTAQPLQVAAAEEMATPRYEPGDVPAVMKSAMQAPAGEIAPVAEGFGAFRPVTLQGKAGAAEGIAPGQYIPPGGTMGTGTFMNDIRRTVEAGYGAS